MALKLMDGFDGYSSASDLNLYYTGSGIGMNTSGGRFGGGALQLNSGGYALNFPQAVPVDGWYGFSFYMGNTGGQGVLCMWSSTGGWEGRIDVTPSTGLIQFYRGNDNYSYGLFSGLTANAWHWIDIHLDFGGSGVAELWVDGTQVINYSGLTYQNSSTGPYNFQIGNGGIGGIQGGFIDDFVTVDTTGSANNGRIGDSKIETLRPTSDASPNNGTPSAGSNHYAVVDDTTWDASDYLTITNTSGQEELFGMSDLSSTPLTIAGVQVVHYSQKTDAGAASLEAVLVSSGTESDGSSLPVAPSWSRYATIYEQDPHTSAAWDAAGVNAVQVGVKVP